jgi:folate-binding protein YgfZ
MSIQQWHEFLQSSNVQDPPHDISTSTLSDTVICNLSHLGLLQIQGTDAITFLQGQVTNDVKALIGNNAHYTGYCNPKGRLLALFLAFVHHDHIHLQAPKTLIESISKRLKMYVLRSKVDIEDVSESIVKIGISGSHAPRLLSALFSKIPQNDYELTSLDNGALLRLPSSQPRFEIFAEVKQAPLIWNTLLENAKPVNFDVWEWLEIQAGIPEVFETTKEEFVPQMLNLDLIGGINFKKGCYTGQEIVARTHYLGSVKRRTHLAYLNSSRPPVPGDNVTNIANETIGKVVRSATAPNGGYDILAEIRLENVATEQVYVANNKLEIKALPYSL